MTRCTEHTRRGPSVPCVCCTFSIDPGERYRIFVSVGDGFGRFRSERAHRWCAEASGAWWWEIHDSAALPALDDESLDYVRERYKLDVHAGDRVLWTEASAALQEPREGRVICGGNYVEVQFDGDRRTSHIHPTEIVVVRRAA